MTRPVWTGGLPAEVQRSRELCSFGQERRGSGLNSRLMQQASAEAKIRFEAPHSRNPTGHVIWSLSSRDGAQNFRPSQRTLRIQSECLPRISIVAAYVFEQINQSKLNC